MIVTFSHVIVFACPCASDFRNKIIFFNITDSGKILGNELEVKIVFAFSTHGTVTEKNASGEW